MMRNNGTNRAIYYRKYKRQQPMLKYVSPATIQGYIGKNIRTYIPGYGNVCAYVRSFNPYNRKFGLDIQTTCGNWQQIQVDYSDMVGKGDGAGFPNLIGFQGVEEGVNSLIGPYLPATGGAATYPPRVNPYEILSCMNNWIRISLKDGTNITAYLSSFNMKQVGGFVSHHTYQTITCKGKVITNIEEAKSCINQWVDITLPNGISLSFYLTSYDENYVGGQLKTSELLPLFNKVENIVCLGS
ncbi:hypothetical protein [Chengkuizengella axinellae]|uniref:Uncharacterized protein n=1 Tax=Chengkuizengella axinellae TaxID=3064388 RepID=A0ABT9IWW5_9BACL|nr:hypothetical protein [Chengkuizengella sp. 2205SS18-9]MDP5273859.1 hypothetical protein [Chengkuizengella sp. 2205SS18-9]